MLYSLIAHIQHSHGFELINLARHPALELSDKIIDKLCKQGLETFKRIGLRTWILIDNSKYTFDTLLKYWCKQNKSIVSAVEDEFGPNNDIGVVLESKNKEDIYLRVCLGPYKEQETHKYFNFKSPITEGLILDIDLYQINLKIPNFKVRPVLINYQNTIESLINAFQGKILGEL